MYNPLNVELPQGYTVFATYGRRTPEIAVELYWQGKMLATALLEVEIQSFNPADDPEAETAWDAHRLHCSVAHLQLLHWNEMPTNSPFDQILSGHDVYELLLQFYPAHVWRPGEEPAFMQDAPVHEGNPLCLDMGENWDSLGAQAYETYRREIQDSVFWSPYSYEEQRDMMLRYCYRQVQQKYPNHKGTVVSQVARALYVGEISERMGLLTLADKKLEYTLREFARGCDRLYDPDAAATVAATIPRLKAEGNIPMLQSLITVITEKRDAFIAFCATDEAAASADWMKRWVENSIRLRTDVAAAILTIQKRDAEEAAVLAQRYRVHMQEGGDVPVCPVTDNVFRNVLERGGFDADAFWSMVLRTIAAEIPLMRDETRIRFLCLNGYFVEDFVAALQNAPAVEAALAQVIHQWCKDWRLPCSLWELEERFPPLYFESDDTLLDFDEGKNASVAD